MTKILPPRSMIALVTPRERRILTTSSVAYPFVPEPKSIAMPLRFRKIVLSRSESSPSICLSLTKASSRARSSPPLAIAIAQVVSMMISERESLAGFPQADSKNAAPRTSGAGSTSAIGRRRTGRGDGRGSLSCY